MRLSISLLAILAIQSPTLAQSQLPDSTPQIRAERRRLRMMLDSADRLPDAAAIRVLERYQARIDSLNERFPLNDAFEVFMDGTISAVTRLSERRVRIAVRNPSCETYRAAEAAVQRAEIFTIREGTDAQSPPHYFSSGYEKRIFAARRRFDRLHVKGCQS